MDHQVVIPLNEHIKLWFDAAFLTTLFGSLTAIVPVLASLASLIWFILRIYETDTVQKLFHKKGNE